MTPTEHLNEIDEFYGRPAATLTLAQIQFGAVLCELRRTSGNVAEAAANLGLGRACVYGLLNNFCRLTRAISSTAPKMAVAALLLVVGCATPNAERLKPETLKQDGPPMPPVTASAERNTRAVAMTAGAPQPPVRTQTWVWEMPAGHRIAYWEVSTNLQQWSFGGWTTNSAATFALTNQCEFFRFFSLPRAISLRIGIGQEQPPDFL